MPFFSVCVIFIRNTCTFILEFISRPYSGLHNNFRKNLGEGITEIYVRIYVP